MSMTVPSGKVLGEALTTSHLPMTRLALSFLSSAPTPTVTRHTMTPAHIKRNTFMEVSLSELAGKDWNAARLSAAKSSGCSHAAKGLPLFGPRVLPCTLPERGGWTEKLIKLAAAHCSSFGPRYARRTDHCHHPALPG